MDEAVLSNKDGFTSFLFNNRNIRFRTSPKLEKYTRILKWDKGYIEVIAKYSGQGEVEEYIDLLPILDNLYIDKDEFLNPVKGVRIEND